MEDCSGNKMVFGCIIQVFSFIHDTSVIPNKHTKNRLIYFSVNITTRRQENDQ